MKLMQKVALTSAVAFCCGCVVLGGGVLLAPVRDGIFTKRYVRERLESMTLRDKVGQMFVIRPEMADSLDFDLYPAGGFCIFAKNISDSLQLMRLTDSLKSLRNEPLLCIDEEGGRVARLANHEAFDLPKFNSMGLVAARGGEAAVYNASATIGSYLKRFGFDVDFAPVADVNTNPDNPVIGTRAFGDDPEQASAMVLAYMKGLEENGIKSCLKHFPGHGDTDADSHLGYVESAKTWDQMLRCEMPTFRAGINAGVPMVMVAHITTPNVTADSLPATLSYTIVTEKLRGELGFDGVVITDAMEMGAIANQYNSARSAVMAVKAGVDIVLMPENYHEAFDALLSAVENGEISEERINDSVRRMILLKGVPNRR